MAQLRYLEEQVPKLNEGPERNLPVYGSREGSHATDDRVESADISAKQGEPGKSLLNENDAQYVNHQVLIALEDQV